MEAATNWEQIVFRVPSGLIARSLDDRKPGIIHVSVNYRLGLYVSIDVPILRLTDLFRAGSPAQHFKKMVLQTRVSMTSGLP